MAREIEDKYLIYKKFPYWRDLIVETSHISQTYLIASKWLTVRTRMETNRPAILCIKLAERQSGTPEYEWRLWQWVAKLCRLWRSRTLEKYRHRIPWDELTIEVDEFLGAFTGLIVAEVEKPSRDYHYEQPAWFGRNVTEDSRYKNAVLFKQGLPSD